MPSERSASLVCGTRVGGQRSSKDAPGDNPFATALVEANSHPSHKPSSLLCLAAERTRTLSSGLQAADMFAPRPQHSKWQSTLGRGASRATCSARPRCLRLQGKQAGLLVEGAFHQRRMASLSVALASQSARTSGLRGATSSVRPEHSRRPRRGGCGIHLPHGHMDAHARGARSCRIRLPHDSGLIGNKVLGERVSVARLSQAPPRGSTNVVVFAGAR